MFYKNASNPPSLLQSSCHIKSITNTHLAINIRVKMCNQIVHRFSCPHVFNVGNPQPCTYLKLVNRITPGHPVTQSITDFTEVCYHCALTRVVSSFKNFVPPPQIQAGVLPSIPQNVLELPGVPLISRASFPTSPTPLPIPGARTTIDYEMIGGVWTAVPKYHIENPTNEGGYNPYHGYDIGSLPPGWARSSYPPSYQSNASNTTLSTIVPQVVSQPPSLQTQQVVRGDEQVTCSYPPSNHTTALSASNDTLPSIVPQVVVKPQTHPILQAVPRGANAGSDNSSTAATKESAHSSPHLSSLQPSTSISAPQPDAVPRSVPITTRSRTLLSQPSIVTLATQQISITRSDPTTVQSMTQTTQRTIRRRPVRLPPVRTSSISSTPTRFSPPPPTQNPSSPDDQPSSSETTPIATHPLPISPPSAILTGPVPMPAPIPALIPRRSSILNRSPPESETATPRSQELGRSRTSSMSSGGGRGVRWADRGEGQNDEGITLMNSVTSQIERVRVFRRRGSDRDDENGALLNGAATNGAVANGHAMNGASLNVHNENGAELRDPFNNEKCINLDECMSGALDPEAEEERKDEPESAEATALETDSAEGGGGMRWCIEASFG
ncbi:hypothetical protein B0J14DRAFT_679728 [Halenospora varia]|nr:hypothetical protein B0J14DRAFT_679728 [Halenospora varia]